MGSEADSRVLGEADGHNEGEADGRRTPFDAQENRLLAFPFAVWLPSNGF
jgi:hypothetical protein